MNYCPDGGWLIADEGRAFNDPVNYDVAGLPTFGCHRLRCSKCGALVRSARALDFLSDERDVDLNPLYELPELRQSPLLYEHPGVRLYLCRCDRWREAIGRPIDSGDDADPFVPRFTWACDGHPLAELPHVFDGVEVTPKNLADVTAKSLRVPPEGSLPGISAAGSGQRGSILSSPARVGRLP